MLKNKHIVSSMLMIGSLAFSQNNNAEKKFGWIDTNKDGKISLNEMKAFYTNKKDKKGKPQNGQLYFLGYDTNNDNSVSLDELKKNINWKFANQKFRKHNSSKKHSTNKKSLGENRLKMMDNDENGYVDLSEMELFYKGKIGKDGIPQKGNYFFIGYDTNEDDKVTLNELNKNIVWKKVMPKIHLIENHEYDKTFNKINKDNNDVLTKDELKEFYKGKRYNNGKKISYKKIIKERDIDGNGKLHLQEFLEIR